MKLVKKQNEQQVGLQQGVEIKTLDDLERAAKLAAASGFFSNARDLARGCMIMQYGLELGISPIASLQNVNVIEGKLSMGGSMIAALIKGSGKYNYKQVEASNKQAKIMFFEHGLEQGIVSYTIEEAKNAGLAHKHNWKKMTTDMLWWRAMSRGARRFCPDIFNGSIYTPEELSEGEYAPDAPVTEPEVVSIKKETPDDLTKAAQAAFVETETKETEILEVESVKKETKKSNSKSKSKSATGLMLSFMRAVDSCEDLEELDGCMDDWEETVKELPRGYDNCVAYWKVAVADFNSTKVDEETKTMADKMSAIKN